MSQSNQFCSKHSHNAVTSFAALNQAKYTEKEQKHLRFEVAFFTAQEKYQQFQG